jgi:hypothetical protein
LGFSDQSGCWFGYANWVLLHLLDKDALDEGPVQTRLMEAIGSVRKEEVQNSSPTALSSAPSPSGPDPNYPSVPDWLAVRLEEHQCMSRRTSPNSLGFCWTRASNGSLVTEYDQYWAEIERDDSGRFGFVVYLKDSGSKERTWRQFDSEQDAIETAQRVLIGPTGTDLRRTTRPAVR